MDERVWRWRDAPLLAWGNREARRRRSIVDEQGSNGERGLAAHHLRLQEI